MSFLPLTYVGTREDFKHLGSNLITEANYFQKQRFYHKTRRSRSLNSELLRSFEEEFELVDGVPPRRNEISRFRFRRTPRVDDMTPFSLLDVL